jgi:hypothetical protein
VHREEKKGHDGKEKTGTMYRAPTIPRGWYSANPGKAERYQITLLERP